MPESSSLLVQGCIQANPDIAGIGVRVAIYAQNFIALISAVIALGDRYVSWKEMQLIETQSMTILLTACALLLSTVIQAATFGMSTYHALIILNLAWMNSTNTLLYAVLFRYQGLVKIPGFKLSFTPQTLKPLPKRKALPLLIIGTLHLSFVAGLGIWFWSKIDTFGARSQCAPRLPLFLVILGHRISVTSRALRIIFLIIYGIIATPGLNLAVALGIVHGAAASCSWAVELFLPVPKNLTFFLPGYITLAFLAGANIAIAVDTETMISQTKAFVQAGESQWTFGQTLAIFMLVLPLKDIFIPLLGEDKQLSKTRERIDEERAVYKENRKRWKAFVPTVKWANAIPVARASSSTTDSSGVTLRSSSFSSTTEHDNIRLHSGNRTNPPPYPATNQSPPSSSSNHLFTRHPISYLPYHPTEPVIICPTPPSTTYPLRPSRGRRTTVPAIHLSADVPYGSTMPSMRHIPPHSAALTEGPRFYVPSE